MNRLRPIQALLWLLYPIAIFLGLHIAEPRYVALFLVLTLVLRRRKEAGQLLSGLSRVNWIILAGLLLLASSAALGNSELLLRFYPPAMSFGMLLLFGLSLVYPPSMVERFARISKPDLPTDGVRYTRRVTQVWCVFFVVNCVAGVYTALYSSREIWVLYNGLIAYLAIGILFAGERLYRRYFLYGTME